jgi:hypothetical protein
MVDAFQVFNLLLIFLLGILIVKNRKWKYQPIVIVFFVMIIALFIFTLLRFQ